MVEINKEKASEISFKMGPLSTLLLVFIVLKLTGLIDWSWVWVLTPLWAIPAFILGLYVVILVICCVWWLFTGKWLLKGDKK